MLPVANGYFDIFYFENSDYNNKDSCDGDCDDNYEANKWDGCYWHGCPDHYRTPKTNSDYWRSKIAGNRARDRETDEMLAAAGWLALRYWEHDPVEEVALAIEEAVRRRRASSSSPETAG